MMKKLNVPAYHKALVFKNNRYIKMLSEGAHWLMPGQTATVYDMTAHFTPQADLRLLLADEALATALLVVDVKPYERALVYKNGIFHAVLSPALHAYWKGIAEYTIQIIDLRTYEITEPVDRSVLNTAELQAYVATYTIAAQQLGLLYVDDVLQAVLQPGTYQYLKGLQKVTVQIYNTAERFTPATDLRQLLENKTLAAALQLVDVKQHERALVYKNDIFHGVLTPGLHAYWKGLATYTVQLIDLRKYLITEPVDKIILNTKELHQYVVTYTIAPHELGLLYVNDVMDSVLEPGTYQYWNSTEKVAVNIFDTRMLYLELNGQDILTKDKANLRLNCSLWYQITDIYTVVKAKDYEKQLYVLLQMALREQVATCTLDELLDKRVAISPLIMDAIKEKAMEMGITIHDCGIKDIVLPGDIKEIMNQVLVAEKKAQANTIMRREETASTRSLLNTAKMMEDNAMLFRLKEMEYVEKIADKISTISLNSGGDLAGQLKQLFVPEKKV